MFGKIADKLNKKFQDSEEEITFKSFNDSYDETETQKTESLGSTLKADESEKDSSIKFKLVKPADNADEIIASDNRADNRQDLAARNRINRILRRGSKG